MAVAGPGAVGVHRHPHPAPHRLAHGVHQAHVVLRPEADLHLAKREALRPVAQGLLHQPGAPGVQRPPALQAVESGGVDLYPLPEGAPQQAVDGQARRPARQVKQRHLGPAQGAVVHRRRGVGPLQRPQPAQGVPQALPVPRVLAHQAGRHVRRHVGRQQRRVPGAVPPPAEPLVRHHLEQHRAAGAVVPLGVVEGVLDGGTQGVAADGGDLHAGFNCTPLRSPGARGSPRSHLQFRVRDTMTYL